MRPTSRARHLICAVIAFTAAGCNQVDVVQISSQTFPPKAPGTQVTLLEHEPKCAYLRLAELRVDDSSSSFATMQQQILEKAAALGADAILFDKPEKRIQHQATYQATPYSPWGYGAYAYPGWGYGGYGWYGYGGYGPYNPGSAMAVPYDYVVRSLKGTAIRYSDSTCRV